jgi:hypothetical protein
MSADLVPFAKIKLGHIVVTPNALRFLTQDDILRGIQRHQAGDWGDLNSADRAANDQAVVADTRILSAYNAVNGTKFWIITEADRSASTILLPEDY